jgi:hypothetical protein
VHRTGQGRWVTPTLGRKLLSGVVLATRLKGGGGYSYALCPGAYGAKSAQASVVSYAAPTCNGYRYSGGSVAARDPLAHPLPGSDDEYANVTFTSATSTIEGVTGGGFAVQCNQPACDFAAFAYAMALDS